MILRAIGALGLLVGAAACSSDSGGPSPTKTNAKDPDKVAVVPVDRFSAEAGMLMVRTDTNGLPAPNAPVDFDSGPPFNTLGLGPMGEKVEYYNFDVQPRTPIPIYVFFRADGAPVDGQLNVIDAIPGG